MFCVFALAFDFVVLLHVYFSYALPGTEAEAKAGISDPIDWDKLKLNKISSRSSYFFGEDFKSELQNAKMRFRVKLSCFSFGY